MQTLLYLIDRRRGKPVTNWDGGWPVTRIFTGCSQNIARFKSSILSDLLNVKANIMIIKETQLGHWVHIEVYTRNNF